MFMLAVLNSFVCVYVNYKKSKSLELTIMVLEIHCEHLY